MVTIYGTKVLVDEDLFGNCGRPKNIIDFIHAEFTNIMNDLAKVCLSIKKPGDYQSADFNLKFIPLDMIEEYIMYRSVISSGLVAISCMANTDKVSEIKNIMNDADKRLNRRILEHLDEGASVENSVCITLVLNEEDNIKDICISTPRNILVKIDSSQTYKCCECNFLEETHSLPRHMFYTIDKNDQLHYLCENCKEKYLDAVHVGDNFYKK